MKFTAFIRRFTIFSFLAENSTALTLYTRAAFIDRIRTMGSEAPNDGSGVHPGVEEVALTVPTTDDPYLPVMTFRMWVLGITSCICLMFFNTFFSYRTQPLSVAATFAQILALPLGRFMAAVLPTTYYTLPVLGSRFTLNPGPFNIKEHVLITIFANAGVSFGGGDAYSVGVINIIKAFYKKNIHFIAAFLIVITTQVCI